MTTLTTNPRMKALSRRLRRVLDDMLAEAKAQGHVHPFLYFEAEGGVYILDGDHEGVVHADLAGTKGRQAAVIFALPDKLPPGSDVGAW